MEVLTYTFETRVFLLSLFLIFISCHLFNFHYGPGVLLMLLLNLTIALLGLVGSLSRYSPKVHCTCLFLQEACAGPQQELFIMPSSLCFGRFSLSIPPHTDHFTLDFF